MKEKILSIVWKVLRCVLPAGAVAMGSVKGSYMKMHLVEGAQTAEEGIEYIAANYFSVSGGGFFDWIPMICMLLSIGAVAMAIYCAFRETEDHLVWLGHLLCLGMVADLVIVIFMTATVWSWCIAVALAAALTITAVQEVQMEKKRNKV